MNYQNLINACNICILACESALKVCSKCDTKCDITNILCNKAENCGAECQTVIEACKQCVHEANVLLENKAFKNNKQELAIKKCKDICEDTMEKCQETINKTINKKPIEACVWSLDILDTCIMACDECIEALNQ